MPAAKTETLPARSPVAAAAAAAARRWPSTEAASPFLARRSSIAHSTRGPMRPPPRYPCLGRTR
eukprot:9486760-Pyramimonas_sp.AAC.1